LYLYRDIYRKLIVKYTKLVIKRSYNYFNFNSYEQNSNNTTL